MSGGLLPNITYSGLGVPLYASVNGSGGLSPLSTITASSITATNVSTFGLNADQFIKSATFFTGQSTMLTTIPAFSSTLLHTEKSAGMWLTTTNYATASGTISYADASIDILSAKVTSSNSYTQSYNFQTTNANPVTTGITMVRPAIGSTAPVEWYWVNNTSNSYVPLSATWTQLG